MLLWTEQFETGQPEIDSQHKRLIDYINRLEALSHTTNPDKGEVEFILELVDFMETYTKVHFQHEENCMLRHRCPAHDENKRAHAEFLQFFQRFKARFESEGYRVEGLRELHDTCKTWIQGHILHIDMQIKPCLNQ